MKPALFAIISIFLGLASCRKEAHEPYLTVSKDSLALGEIVVAKVINARPDTRFVWHSIGAMGEAVPKGDKIRMSYSFPGKRAIEVSLVAGSDSIPYASFTKEIIVSHDDFKFPVATIPITGGQLQLAPFFMYDSTLAFIVRSNLSYSCFQTYVIPENYSQSNSIIKISFVGASTSGTCEQTNTTAQNFMFVRKYYINGSFPVELTFNNKLYKGTLEVTNYNRRYEFKWPYTDGVVISPRVFIN